MSADPKAGPGVPAAGLAGARVADLEERVEHLTRELAGADGDRARILRGAIRRTREELGRRGITDAYRP